MHYKKYTRKQEFVIITFILLLALISTYFIYNKFTTERKVDYNSDKVEVIFEDKSEEKLTITKVTPLTDNVGLSSTTVHNITVKNNLTEATNLKIQILDDAKKILDDNCSDKVLTKENIRISINASDEENKIYTLSELQDGILYDGKLKALEEKKFSIRIWVDHNTALTSGSDYHYHGLIKVIDNNEEYAINN